MSRHQVTVSEVSGDEVRHMLASSSSPHENKRLDMVVFFDGDGYHRVHFQVTNRMRGCPVATFDNLADGVRAYNAE